MVRKTACMQCENGRSQVLRVTYREEPQRNGPHELEGRDAFVAHRGDDKGSGGRSVLVFCAGRRSWGKEKKAGDRKKRLGEGQDTMKSCGVKKVAVSFGQRKLGFGDAGILRLGERKGQREWRQRHTGPRQAPLSKDTDVSHTSACGAAFFGRQFRLRITPANRIKYILSRWLPSPRLSFLRGLSHVCSAVSLHIYVRTSPCKIKSFLSWPRSHS